MATFMDAAQLQGMLNTCSTPIASAVESIITGAEQRADADRNSFTAAITALAVNTRRGGTRDHSSNRSDRYEKVEDLAASIIKSQKTAVDWANEPEKILDPDVIKVDIWKHELNQQFSSSFCVDVGKFAGYECYKRQSLRHVRHAVSMRASIPGIRWPAMHAHHLTLFTKAPTLIILDIRGCI